MPSMAWHGMPAVVRASEAGSPGMDKDDGIYLGYM